MEEEERINTKPFLIKLGEEEHIKNLLYKGELFFRPIEEYRELSDKDLKYLKECAYKDVQPDKNKYDYYRTDTREGLESSINVSARLKLKIKEGLEIKDIPEIPEINIKDAKLNTFQNLYKYIICFYYPEIISFEKEKKLSFNEDVKKFGEYFILIHKPNEFLKRIASKITFDYGPIEYCDDVLSSEKHPVFRKRSMFSPQQEFRIATKENLDNKKIYIGNLEDIACICETEKSENIEMHFKF